MGLIDKHYYNHRSVTERVTENVNVKEYRAPTDESLKLLKELDQTAKNNILFSITNKDNVINGTILAIATGFSSLPHLTDNPNVIRTASSMMDVEIHYRFTLNGKEYNGKDTIDYYDIGLQNAYKSKDGAELFYARFMAKKLSELISIQLVKEFFINKPS